MAILTTTRHAIKPRAGSTATLASDDDGVLLNLHVNVSVPRRRPPRHRASLRIVPRPAPAPSVPARLEVQREADGAITVRLGAEEVRLLSRDEATAFRAAIEEEQVRDARCAPENRSGIGRLLYGPMGGVAGALGHRRELSPAARRAVVILDALAREFDYYDYEPELTKALLAPSASPAT